MTRWLKLLAGNALVAAVLLTLVLGSMEAYFRWTIPPEPVDSIFEYTTETKRFRLMKPGIVSMPWDREFRTNDLGFRDRDATIPAKQPGEFRVAVIGDSVTAGAGLNFESLYTTQLERRLQQRAPNSTVINLGVATYNIVQYELLLEEVAYPLEPDLVVVALVPRNDLLSGVYRRSERTARYGSEGAVRTQFEKLHIYRVYLRRIPMVRRMFADEDESDTTAATRVADATENLAALDRIVASTAARKVPLIIALLPYTDGFERQRRDFAPFVDHCNRRRYSCLNLLDGLIASGLDPESLPLNPVDFHPDERYHDLMARLLSERIAGEVKAAAVDALNRRTFGPVR